MYGREQWSRRVAKTDQKVTYLFPFLAFRVENVGDISVVNGLVFL